MYKILLVEDDKNISELIVNYFIKKEKGVFQLDTASDGQTGLERRMRTITICCCST